MFHSSEFLWERIPSSASGTLGRMVGTALFLPAELVLGLVPSCWCRPGCCLWGLFSWSRGKAFLIIWPLSHGTFAVNGMENLPFYEASPEGTISCCITWLLLHLKQWQYSSQQQWKGEQAFKSQPCTNVIYSKPRRSSTR